MKGLYLILATVMMVFAIINLTKGNMDMCIIEVVVMCYWLIMVELQDLKKR